MNQQYDIIIVGGGASGFFTAINIAEQQPHIKIAILERGKEVLSKVRISGGGRCNVTHACFEPNELVKFYPRGEKELKGPFHQFCSGDTVEWFENHGVTLKTEPDGRMFPESNSAQTIIDCFLKQAQQYAITVLTNHSVQHIFKSREGWKIETHQAQFWSPILVLCTGSNPKIWEMLQNQGHAIIPPVPSLFTFNTRDVRIQTLPGVATKATIQIKGTKFHVAGDLLVTHWGLSGPAILKLSAIAARYLAEINYKFEIIINWLFDTDTTTAFEILLETKKNHAKKAISKKCPFQIPNRLWEQKVIAAAIPTDLKWADCTKTQLQQLLAQLLQSTFQINGKSTFKEEFVTAGGIDLKEINFKTMESKLHPNLYFAGEILNIDAVTGGFNFQNAWTTGHVVARAIVNEYI
ncbi:BaiN/RdsA family NAD(P)/FAD-dependent oxidoreductase [Flavobacterium branchiophilum]|uniref:Aminoacetone oxidase family FAD-binding enzyme n=1 Tax=Flavobacterium branchiophilum TaxID=55197 RepID=A0A2H3KAK6_9FLAO|nr:NAD(P)/FAD-dependent oxidoreductase [Flavobacterium branchiophilum]PDS23705.1 aminoacetone oxidase family FAD-binding enzyme [Flavobacterium branchiophilum]